MKFTIERAKLAHLLTNVGRVVEQRNTIPILSHVMLSATPTTPATDGGNLAVQGTDLDIVATAGTEAEVAAPGAVCVEAKLLSDIVKKAGATEIAFSLEGDKLIVKSGRSRFSLSTLPATDFPNLDGGNFDVGFDIDLASLFAPVSFAMSTEETRFYLNGVYLHNIDGRIVAVATDGHRLARHIGPVAPLFEGVIVPRKVVGVLPKGSAHVSLSTTKIRIVSDDMTLTSKLIDGTFPDYQRVIPTGNDKIATFDASAMRSAVDRVSTVASVNGRGVKLAFSSGEGGEGAVELSVADANHGTATDEVAAAYGADALAIGFNSKYLVELVGQFPPGDVKLAMRDEGSPSVFTSDGAPDLLAVLMPCRV